MSEKRDYSDICTMDDNHDKRCWSCQHFVFPIGCMECEEAINVTVERRLKLEEQNEVK